MSAPARALVFDSTYQTAINERDQARQERDDAKRLRDEAIQARISDLKSPNPALVAQLDDAARRQSIISDQLVDMQRARGLWQAVAIGAFVVGPIMGCVIGLAIGTKTKHDYILHQSANMTPKSDDGR